MKDATWILIDTETTGLKQPIFAVEIAAQRMRGWQRDGEPFRRLINHGCEIPQEAARVHGYTREILERDGESPEAVYSDFREYTGDAPIVAYNLRYDWNQVLVPEWERLGLLPISSPGFCAYLLAQRLLDPFPAGNCKLQTLRQYYRLPERGAHTALGDVETVADLMQEILRPIAEKRGLDTWEKVKSFSLEEWYPTRLVFGKFKGRSFLDAREDSELRSWLEWLTRSSNERSAQMGQWYIDRLDSGKISFETPVIVEASNQLSPLYRVGDHKLQDPDYRLVCAWAKETGWSNKKVLGFLLEKEAEVRGGRFVKLVLRDPLNSIPLIEGLEVTELNCNKTAEEFYTDEKVLLIELDLTPVPKLEKLSCRNNKLIELDLTPVPNLKELECFQNNLTELDLTPVPNLKKLDCHSNKLIELDLMLVPKLESLKVTFDELDLTPVPNLKELEWGGNRDGNNLTELDLTPVPKLEKLSCSRNGLIELDLTPVPNLEVLECFLCDLIKLDLTPVPNLKELDCTGNRFSVQFNRKTVWKNRQVSTNLELDLTPVPNLKELYCGTNALTELDLTPVPNLERLNCSVNNLTELDLKPVPHLKVLHCCHNKFTELDLTPVPNLKELSSDV